MSEPSTKILDHIIHLSPPDTVAQVSEEFKRLGFQVIPGGTHADGLTANALVLLQDGVYIELISFLKPAKDYPPVSDRNKHQWAGKNDGWIDYAFLGSTSASIAEIINQRAKDSDTDVAYLPEVHGGRTRSDGETLKWAITAPEARLGRGSLPFYCADVTPRKLRVPIDHPPGNTEHPSGAAGIAHVRLLASPPSLKTLASQLSSVIGEQPTVSHGLHVWTLDVPKADTPKPLLILGAPADEEETKALDNKGPGIYEVAFWTGKDGKKGDGRTEYGSKIVWRPL
ncbi:hypothetical protein CONPUDRAFT_48792 [Coniophora puteana RWD-64-598 SS2]|uniref:Glyoxalase-like domain-containing protein n=1 Tax=Coniophora puteana (strain RWD-64-598) TaxID=741705 RepID=A0A5M3N2G5_CONPW|nr:uncharacterized protein CONPUDRAFT_48792 [Coniophora puteana RWD-64-598 SS2]EIW85580.1 hypothetical protein CONPUDRAFT_48792 [Coniophora puteana RWD-64-598 SS2]